MAELRKQTASGLFWKMINSLSTTGVTFIISIILARLLTPKDYGVIAMIAVFTAFLQIFTDGGLTTALIRKENRTEEDLATVFWYNLFACYIVYGILFCLAPWVETFYDMSGLCSVMRVTTLSLLITPFSSIQTTLMTTRIDFKTPAFISVVASILSGIIAVVMAYLEYGVWALVVQGLVSSLITVFFSCYLVKWYPKTFFSKSSFLELFAFSSKMLLSRILTTVYAKIAPLIIGKYYSPADLGAMERGKNWALLPSDTITGTVSAVSFPVLSKVQDDNELLRSAYRKMIRIASFIVFPLCLGLASIGRPLTLVILTDKWEGSIIFLYIYCYIAMWMPMNILNLNLLLIKGRSDLTFKLEVYKKIIGFTMMFVTLPFGLLFFCFGDLVCASGIFLVMNLYYTGKILNLSVLKQVKDVVPFLLNCLVMTAISLVVQIPFGDNLLKLFSAIPCSCVYYILSSLLFFKNDVNEVVSLLWKGH